MQLLLPNCSQFQYNKLFQQLKFEDKEKKKCVNIINFYLERNKGFDLGYKSKIVVIATKKFTV